MLKLHFLAPCDSEANSNLDIWLRRQSLREEGIDDQNGWHLCSWTAGCSELMEKRRHSIDSSLDRRKWKWRRELKHDLGNTSGKIQTKQHRQLSAGDACPLWKAIWIRIWIKKLKGRKQRTRNRNNGKNCWCLGNTSGSSLSNCSLSGLWRKYAECLLISYAKRFVPLC